MGMRSSEKITNSKQLLENIARQSVNDVFLEPAARYQQLTANEIQFIHHLRIKKLEFKLPKLFKTT